MGSKKKPNSRKSSPRAASRDSNMSIQGLHMKHQQELQNLTLTTQPLKTLKFFLLAITQYIKRSVLYLLAHRWFMVLCLVVLLAGILLLTIDGPHEKHIEELYQYLQFGLWWVALGVASSIGLGSGLHTFVLYLGPHIALFTIKAMKCGRVDIKSAPYDTVQLNRVPSWLGKDCSEFGSPLFSSLPGSRVPLSCILPRVQLEAVLWGIGTALGELPPYFISRAANLSGSKLDAMEGLDAFAKDGVISTRLNQFKHWFLSHSQYFNFFTILVLASVPNPLFDLAGIICGQFGIPFWKFFLATLMGKAIIKTHIQTVFIISVCNNQLLDWIETEFIWVFSFIPGLASVLPNLISKLKAMRNKYMATPTPAPMASNITDLKANKWDLSFSSLWSTVVWLMILNFFFKIVTSTAQSYLKKQQEKELASTHSK
ncbi:hypothetical protein NMG60_11029886 [Bertholletia excelsa]